MQVEAWIIKKGHSISVLCPELHIRKQPYGRKVVHTGAPEFLALDLSDALVGQAARAGTASPTCLYRIGTQVVCQPLQVAVADKRVLGQMAAGGKKEEELRTPIQESESC